MRGIISLFSILSLAALGLTALLPFGASAMPLSPKALERAQAFGPLSEAILAGPPAWVNAPSPAPSGGHTGNYRLLLILMDFSDSSHVFSDSTFEEMAFILWPNGSMREYFEEASYGKLGLSGAVKGWYPAAHSRAYYADGQKGWGTYPQNAGRLAEEAVDAAEAAGVNFSLFDNDGDGTAESVIIVHCGEGAETSLDVNDIQSHKSTISSMGGTPRYYDGVTVDIYACCPEFQTSSPATHINIGVFCHEYGHVLGLPDLYDVGWYCTGITGKGIGAWGLMGYGGYGGDVVSPQSPTHLCAWSKIQMGWLTPVVANGWSTDVDLYRLEQSPHALKIGMNQRETEYILVAFRDSSYGFDQSLTRGGMLIWHIDDDAVFWNDCENGGSCTSGGLNYMVALEQPDGNYDLDCGTPMNYADRGDMYPYQGIAEFTASTTPNTDTYEGTPSGVSLTNIAVIDTNRMALHVESGMAYPVIGYDDGGRENCYSWGAAQSGFAVRITPPEYPALIQGLQILSCDVSNPDFQCRIWDDDGSGGRPGTALSPLHTTSGASAYVWTYEDFSADSIVIESGDFWAVYIEYNNSDLATDTSSSWSGRTMMYYLDSFYNDYGSYGNYLIRGVVSLANCAGVEPRDNPEADTEINVAASPNPFVQATSLAFSLGRATEISLSVYDVNGRLVKTLANRRFEPGSYSVDWDGTDSRGRKVGAGVYFYRLVAPGTSRLGKMSLLR